MKVDALPTTSAVVIGGSLAGVCAARVLSDFVDTVTIVERDAYPSAHDFRPGVPQARHVHNLLARGLREFEGFFPGFDRRMREGGAIAVESGWDVATLWPMAGISAATRDYGRSMPVDHLSNQPSASSAGVCAMSPFWKARK